jgi:DNA invertase Pin-like site-specific DNA recombinase
MTTRPSASGKEVDNQRRQLRQFCDQQGWEIVAEYIDEDSGAKSDRAGFQNMWRDAAERQFDVLLFWAFDRFSREGVLETPELPPTPHVLRDQLALTLRTVLGLDVRRRVAFRCCGSLRSRAGRH